MSAGEESNGQTKTIPIPSINLEVSNIDSDLPHLKNVIPSRHSNIRSILWISGINQTNPPIWFSSQQLFWRSENVHSLNHRSIIWSSDAMLKSFSSTNTLLERRICILFTFPLQFKSLVLTSFLTQTSDPFHFHPQSNWEKFHYISSKLSTSKNWWGSIWRLFQSCFDGSPIVCKWDWRQCISWRRSSINHFWVKFAIEDNFGLYI